MTNTVNHSSIKSCLLEGLTKDQKRAVRSAKRRVLVVAGAGSGKTEVMARRVAWWVGVDKVPKDHIVAFTFTEKAAEEMKFRIRKWIERITPEGQDTTLAGMYVGTIHGFCLKKLREYWPDKYHNYDVIDEVAKRALVLRGFNGILGLAALQSALDAGRYETVEKFLLGYDLLQEYDLFDIKLPSGSPPIHLGKHEHDWCLQTELLTKVGNGAAAEAFSRSAARYYGYLHCRRFLDFSTSQSEFLRALRGDSEKRTQFRQNTTHLLVDELQDINPVQANLIELIVGPKGFLTAVGDHRQAIYGWRGGRVDLLAELWEDIKADSKDGVVVDLAGNFRSTKEIVTLANNWARTIGRVRTMTADDMEHGRTKRRSYHRSHTALLEFASRDQESDWITRTIQRLVPDPRHGARHDTDKEDRGITHGDIAVLLRSSTDARTYMQALENKGIPAVFRAGPDLFSQPEVLLFIGALAITADMSEFYGSPFSPKSLPNRILGALDCAPQPEAVVKKAFRKLRASGLSVDSTAEKRLLTAAELIHARIQGEKIDHGRAGELKTPSLRKWLLGKNTLRRVFPQQIYHFLLSEAGADGWDADQGRGATVMFHLGALSGLVTGMETPGWTSAEDYKWQVISLCQFGAAEGRTEEAPLLVPPDAVTISTVHGAKGLEFPVVFLADVCARRFPSQFARHQVDVPFSGSILRRIKLEALSDNDNYDQERRLMYVALTRAERYLFVSCSGTRRSRFIKQLSDIFDDFVGAGGSTASQTPATIQILSSERKRDFRLATSFSDLRYFLECPHDFYLRKVLGFAPTIDQAFGYGKGVHNLLRAIHSDPKKWAKLSLDDGRLRQALQKLIDQGLFYLRYTTGEPASNMRQKGLEVVCDYVKTYVQELERLEFEPEKEFETLISEEDILISGAIDVVRLDDPPRVTLVDFKSGESDAESASGLDEEEMRLQISLYGLAAKHELEYDPEHGLVRYVGETDPQKRQLSVNLDEATLKESRDHILRTAQAIKRREFHLGPSSSRRGRCSKCDFISFCGVRPAKSYRKQPQANWKLP